MPTSPPSAAEAGWRLEHSYAALPGSLHTAVAPTPVSQPRLVVLNQQLAASLGLNIEALTSTDASKIFSGNSLPPNAAPLAQAYAGHQYGHFTMLGDGRAILLGEQITPRGERFDIQLKGSGPTPFSRRGDGRAALGPMLREYIISEAMHALGIPTTRSLAVTVTGEDVWRPDARPGAVLTRVAASHIRIGTLEYAAARRDEIALRALLAHTLQRHYPDRANSPNPALVLLEAVIERHAALVARWMFVGFVHGVLNTDNVALSGETIDYGPCAFIDAYDPATTFSSIDRHGRYAFGQQPQITLWNLTRLAESLLTLLDPVETRALALAEEALHRFESLYRQHWLTGLRRKLGLFTEEPDDEHLGQDLFAWMHETRADFTHTFAALAATEPPAQLVTPEWQTRWRARLQRQPQSPAESARLRQAHCPALIPRNHRVEAALSAAEQGDFSELHRLIDLLSTPYDHTRPTSIYHRPGPPDAPRYQTFCGT